MTAETLTSATALDLLSTGRCWPTCLLAMGDQGGCACPCDGAYHGALLDVSVTPWEDSTRCADCRRSIRFHPMLHVDGQLICTTCFELRNIEAASHQKRRNLDR